MKTGKSRGMDDIPSELICSGEEGTVKAQSALCQKIWEQKKWLTEWTKSLVNTPHQRRDVSDNLGLQDHKVDQPPKQGAASFGAGLSTVERIFDCRVLIAKHLEHQRNLYHNFIDFKKAFDRVCHDILWKVLLQEGIRQSLP